MIEVQSPLERMTKPELELELKDGASRELLIEISILIEEVVNIGSYCPLLRMGTRIYREVLRNEGAGFAASRLPHTVTTIKLVELSRPIAIAAATRGGNPRG
jgi:hypothetical protein